MTPVPGASQADPAPDRAASSPVRPSDAPSAPPLPLGAPGLTWFRLHAGTTVIDFPLPASPGARTWVATIWPDARAPGGWVRQPWQAGPAGRGFVPVAVELGDIVQFGVEHPAVAATARPGRPGMAYWHGYLHAVRPDSVLLHGPYVSPHEAYAAAQHALLAQIHHGAAEHPGRPGAPTAHLGVASGSAPVTPAQPPATVSVAFHGRQATIGDPVHGWLVVGAERLLAAMPYPAAELARLLTPHVPRLTGQEPLLTLAALAAHHLPHQLPIPAAGGPPGPAAAPEPPPPTPPIPEASL